MKLTNVKLKILKKYLKKQLTNDHFKRRLNDYKSTCVSQILSKMN